MPKLVYTDGAINDSKHREVAVDDLCELTHTGMPFQITEITPPTADRPSGGVTGYVLPDAVSFGVHIINARWVDE